MENSGNRGVATLRPPGGSGRRWGSEIRQALVRGFPPIAHQPAQPRKLGRKLVNQPALGAEFPDGLGNLLMGGLVTSGVAAFSGREDAITVFDEGGHTQPTFKFFKIEFNFISVTI